MDAVLVLIAFKHEPAARLLVDYLKSQGINARYVLDEESQGHCVTLEQTEDISKGKTLTEEFLRDPGNQKYQRAAWEFGDQLEAKSSTGFAAFRRIINFARTPFTSIVLLFCAAVFAFSSLGWWQSLLKKELREAGWRQSFKNNAYKTNWHFLRPRSILIFFSIR